MQCEAMRTFDHVSARPLEVPIRCTHKAREGSPFCGTHLHAHARMKKTVETGTGGFCVGCSKAATRYFVSRVPLDLCLECARSLRIAIFKNEKKVGFKFHWRAAG